MNAPMAATSCHRAFGRGTKKIAGSRTTTNLIATNNSAGTPSSPSSTTTKLVPQMTTTITASRASFSGTCQPVTKMQNGWPAGSA
jgi:hypothetical protein